MYLVFVALFMLLYWANPFHETTSTTMTTETWNKSSFIW